MVLLLLLLFVFLSTKPLKNTRSHWSIYTKRRQRERDIWSQYVDDVMWSRNDNGEEKTIKHARVCCLHEETKSLLLQCLGGFSLHCLGLNDLARDKKRKKQLSLLSLQLDWDLARERRERERGERRPESVFVCNSN